MDVVATAAETRARCDEARGRGLSVGFVPTMGFLHDGHLSLMQAARSARDTVVASIFVNPLQFGPSEDLEAYPRDLDRDLRLCEQVGVDLVFTPSPEEMYAEPFLTGVSVAGITASMEGAARPSHFDGVTTVVAKLFNIVGPCAAFFGEKDWQQLVTIRQMVRDLSMPIDVAGCPIVREPDGLALSSRNAYLGAEERRAATVLHRALRAGADTIETGARRPQPVVATMRQVIDAEPLADIEYAEVVTASSLAPVDELAGQLRLLVAARVGPARLLDNMGVSV